MKKIDIRGLLDNARIQYEANKPTVWILMGVGGVVLSAVELCRATLKVSEERDWHEHRLGCFQSVVDAAENKELLNTVEEYLHTEDGMKAAMDIYGCDGEEAEKTIDEILTTLKEKPDTMIADAKKAINREKRHYFLFILKSYGPAVLLMVLSIMGIVGGDWEHRERQIGLAAAYATLKEADDILRNNVREKYGEEELNRLQHGVEKQKIEVTETDENGKEKKIKKTVSVAKQGLNGYARYFGFGYSPAAEPSFDYNAMFLEQTEQSMNSKLRIQGFLFLNDLWEALGYEKTIEGQFVGWIYDRNDEDHGDNRINLRIEEIYKERDGVPDSYERIHMIDPNVDGPILERLREKGFIKDE